jgi:hypothetical protein
MSQEMRAKDFASMLGEPGWNNSDNGWSNDAKKYF